MNKCQCPKCGNKDAKTGNPWINGINGEEIWPRFVYCPTCGTVDTHEPNRESPYFT